MNMDNSASNSRSKDKNCIPHCVGHELEKVKIADALIAVSRQRRSSQREFLRSIEMERQSQERIVVQMSDSCNNLSYGNHTEVRLDSEDSENTIKGATVTRRVDRRRRECQKSLSTSAYNSRMCHKDFFSSSKDDTSQDLSNATDTS
jgi:hypothetical protein